MAYSIFFLRVSGNETLHPVYLKFLVSPLTYLCSEFKDSNLLHSGLKIMTDVFPTVAGTRVF